MKKRKRICILLLAGLFCLGGAGCKKEKKEYLVYMPDGAPALALAGLMIEERIAGVDYRVVAPSLIASKVTGKAEEKNADFCVLPLTAASKLLGTGEKYVMLGTLTHGNLYLLAKGGEKIENLSALLGKKVGVLQINEVPGLTFKATMQKQGIAYQELTNEGGMAKDKVNLLAISGADAVGTVEADCFLIAEPAATAQSKKGYQIVGNLQELYGGENGYPQAVLVGKKSLTKKEAWLENFLRQVEISAANAAKYSGESLVAAVSAHFEDKSATTSLKAPLLTAEVISRCGISFTYAYTNIQETQGFLSALLAVNSKAAAIPNREFYWSKA